ncbi:unnamed protein product [Rhodiola kirilowii]
MNETLNSFFSTSVLPQLTFTPPDSGNTPHNFRPTSNHSPSIIDPIDMGSSQEPQIYNRAAISLHQTW